MTTDRTEQDRWCLTAYVRISKPHQIRCIPLPGDVSGDSRGVSRLPLTPRATCKASKISFSTTIKVDRRLHERGLFPWTFPRTPEGGGGSDQRASSGAFSPSSSSRE